MRHIFLAVLCFFSYLNAMTLDEIVVKALETSPSLESISHRISANRSKIELSDQFANPEVIYSENTLDDREPMSRRTFTVKQKISYYGKRDSRAKIAKAQESVLNKSLEKSKSALVKLIKEKAYTIWELERTYEIICNYEELTRHNIELFESYTMTSDNQHMGIMSAELTLSDLRIQKSTLNAKIDAAYADLSYLAAFDVNELKIDLFLGEMPGLSSLKEGLMNNHDISLKEKVVQKQRAKVENANLNSYPDISLIGGYSSRNNFDDYWTFGLGMTLPIYGKEDHKEEETRKLALAAQSMKEDMVIAVDAKLQNAYSQMKAAYESYHIINDDALPQIEHMFELTSSSISTGGDLFKYIDILVQKLKLEQKSITAVANYNRAAAKIAELSGAIQ